MLRQQSQKSRFLSAARAVSAALSHPEKASIHKLKYEALEISEVGGPFERKVLMHYSYIGPL